MYTLAFEIRSGTKYAGEYHYDDERDVITGCPARAQPIRALIKIVRTRANKKGAAATRHHAEAMTRGDLRVIMEWSASQFPIESVEWARAPRVDSAPVDLATALKHAMMRAFLSSGFTLWTR